MSTLKVILINIFLLTFEHKHRHLVVWRPLLQLCAITIHGVVVDVSIAVPTCLVLNLLPSIKQQNVYNDIHFNFFIEKQIVSPTKGYIRKHEFFNATHVYL